MLRRTIFGVVSFVILCGAASAENENKEALAGDWLLPGAADVLSIDAGGNWLHPKYGRAKIREANDGADFGVFYADGGIRCSYRASFSEGGETLNLSAADPSQDPEYCPVGNLRAVNHEKKGLTRQRETDQPRKANPVRLTAQMKDEPRISNFTIRG